MTENRNGKTMLATAFVLALFVALPPAARAQSGAAELAPRLLFAVSGGFWKGQVKLNTSIDDAAKASGEASDSKNAAKGYYRISAYRADDNTSHLYLQRLALDESTPKILETMDVGKINDLHAYVIDIRQDNGSAAAQGFSAFVVLKRDPKAAETEMWTVFVDEYGTVTVEKPTN